MWPFRGSNRPAALPPLLREIGDDTRLRFSIALAEPNQSQLARAVLVERLGRELIVEDDAAVLQLASAFQPGSAAVLRPLNVLDRAGIAVSGLELMGLVVAVTDHALRQVVHDWAVRGNTGPYRRRVERLAGPALLDRCLTEADAARHSQNTDAAAWRFAVHCVAFNTAGAEVRLLDEAATSDHRRAEDLVDAAFGRIQLARLAGLSVDVPADSLASCLGRPGHVAELAARLACQLPGPLDVGVTGALRELAGRGGASAQTALSALGNAAPSSEVRASADAALASDDSNIRAAGLALLARHWTDDARPVWRAFLLSNSGPTRWMAEGVISRYGTAEDLPDAAVHLAKLIRSRQAITMSPPRGSEIVDLLARHREHPEARVALDDLTARWSRLSEDLRAWLAVHHPWLAPGVAPAGEPGIETMPEETLTWPPPSVERDGSSYVLTFDESGAHHPVRERFDLLVERHSSIEVIEGDRDQIWVTLDTADPEGLVRALWATASDGSLGA